MAATPQPAATCASSRLLPSLLRHAFLGGLPATAGEPSESESKPAATKASGLADGQGKPKTNGESTANRGRHPAGNGAAAKAVPQRTSAADTAAVLERAGLRMATDPGTSVDDRQSQFAKFQIDAPACENCGAITVRNGNCYLCHNCGNSMGCS